MIQNYERTQRIQEKRAAKYGSYHPASNYDSKSKDSKQPDGYYNHTLNKYVFDDAQYLEDIDEEEEDDVIHDEVGAAVAAAARGRRGGHIGVPNGFIPGQPQTQGGTPPYSDNMALSRGKR